MGLYALVCFSLLFAAGLCQLHTVNDHCQKDCSHSRHRTVCGSDGVTYPTQCDLMVGSCIHHEYHGTTVRMLHYGSCRNITHHVRNHCNDLCDEVMNPICASDGQVYTNKCRFLRAQCEAAVQGVNLFAVTMGHSCPATRSPDCSKYIVDTSDLAFEGNTVFQAKCPSTHASLCGSDGHTFTNECQMCAYAENNNVTLTILNDAPCAH